VHAGVLGQGELLLEEVAHSEDDPFRQMAELSPGLVHQDRAGGIQLLEADARQIDVVVELPDLRMDD
jgi:hypothetical protein